MLAEDVRGRRPDDELAQAWGAVAGVGNSVVRRGRSQAWQPLLSQSTQMGVNIFPNA